MGLDIEEAYKLAKQGKIPEEYVQEIFTQGFDDYNNDFSHEITFIIKSFLKNDKNILDPVNISPIVSLITYYNKALFKEFTDKIMSNGIKISEDNFMKIVDSFYYSDNIEYIKDRKNKFIDYAINQQDFSLTELNNLKVFTQYETIALKMLKKETLSFSQPLYNYLNQHYLYKDTIKDKVINIIPIIDNTIEHLSHELVLTANYINKFISQEISYDPVSLNYNPQLLNPFLTQTYKMIFDPTNNNRDKFIFEFAKKNINIAIEMTKPIVQKNITEIRQQYTSDHPFFKLKK